MTEIRANPSFWKTAIRGLVVLCVLLVLGGLAILPRVEKIAIGQAAAREETTMRIATESLRSALSRTEALPSLLAERPILARVLREPNNQGLLPFANEQLRQSALMLGVSDIFVMDLNGLTVAASDYRRDDTVLGQVFDYRPFLEEAIKDGRGRFHAFDPVSQVRSYYFAAPILEGTEIVGVVTVRIFLDSYEESWRNGDNTIIVVDTNNVVFLSSRPDWHFLTLEPLSADSANYIAETRQYPTAALAPLEVAVASFDADTTLFEVSENEAYVVNTGLVAAAGWRVMVLTPTRTSIAQARQGVALVVLGLLIAGLVTVLFLQRRARLVERIEQQRATQELLETRVEMRTADLNAANTQLIQEVEERRLAEKQLRQTQTELVQAGKLAALGQMSAALSHEFNQPLAAVKSYAENAATFLDRDRPDNARENVLRISQMADRMASISKHLRNFARRPQEKQGPVSLFTVLDGALALTSAKLREAGGEIIVSKPDDDVAVVGGQVRLQQVVVNLIANALDAMEGHKDPVVDINIALKDDLAVLTVRDTGQGLSDEAKEQIFDPFYTTKSPGKGLGLGLSISYNIIRDFGGRLSATNHPKGGAVFALELKRAEEERKT